MRVVGEDAVRGLAAEADVEGDRLVERGRVGAEAAGAGVERVGVVEIDDRAAEVEALGGMEPEAEDALVLGGPAREHRGVAVLGVAAVFEDDDAGREILRRDPAGAVDRELELLRAHDE